MVGCDMQRFELRTATGRDRLGQPVAHPRKAVVGGQHDVIVVAPYNAQVECLRESLDAAGVSLDCTPARAAEEPGAWRMP